MLRACAAGLVCGRTSVSPKGLAGLHHTATVLRSLPVLASSSLWTSVDTSVNAWSVNGATLGSADLASTIFASSLFPYLVLLFFLSRPETKAPRLGNFGFQFLLVFVAATIPAGIYAKVAYGDILANIDW